MIAQMRSSRDIISQMEKSRSMMDFYFTQMEVLLDIRNLVEKLVELGGIPKRKEEEIEAS